MGCVNPETTSPQVRPWQCRGRVLLISDRELPRVAMAEALGVQGFDVHGAASHLDACSDEGLAGWDFDVVVLDIHHASFDPAQAVGKLKQTYRSARVVLCSGAMAGAALGRALAAGAFAFIMKPFDAGQMACMVQMAMDRVPSNDRGCWGRA